MMLLHMRHAVTFFVKLPCILVKEVNNQNMLQKTHVTINPLNAELNPICHLLALVGTHHILHISRIRVKYNMDESRYTTHSENIRLKVLLLRS
jgi:hypothetical protein